MPHLVVLYTANLESATDVDALCRSLADTLIGVRDEQGAQVYPTGGVRVLAYPLPDGWGRPDAEIAFRFPRDTLVEQPYGFWVRPRLVLPDGGNPSDAAPELVSTGFGEGYQQFSWAPETWQPAPDLRCGTNMLDWVRSFHRRLTEVN